MLGDSLSVRYWYIEASRRLRRTDSIKLLTCLFVTFTLDNDFFFFEILWRDRAEMCLAFFLTWQMDWILPRKITYPGLKKKKRNCGCSNAFFFWSGCYFNHTSKTAEASIYRRMRASLRKSPDGLEKRVLTRPSMNVDRFRPSNLQTLCIRH